MLPQLKDVAGHFCTWQAESSGIVTAGVIANMLRQQNRRQIGELPYSCPHCRYVACFACPAGSGRRLKLRGFVNLTSPYLTYVMLDHLRADDQAGSDLVITCTSTGRLNKNSSPGILFIETPEVGGILKRMEKREDHLALSA